MKNSLVLLALTFLIAACSDTKKNNRQTFENNVATFNQVVEAFKAEDADKVVSYFADSLKWVGPAKKNLEEFNSKSFFHEELKKYFSVYHQHDLRDLTFYAGSIYSTGENITDPNRLIVFGNRHHVHSGSIKDVSHKWMAVLYFNEVGKIYYFSDFYDVTGFLNQHNNQ
jgi:hypothetical protein